MPFDQTIQVPETVQNLLTLADALEGKLPSDFHWDFEILQARGDCGIHGCAVGLAIELGLVPQRITSRFGGEGVLDPCVQATFGLTYDQARLLFSAGRYNSKEVYGKLPEAVTPQDVAAKLRQVAQEQLEAVTSGSKVVETVG